MDWEAHHQNLFILLMFLLIWSSQAQLSWQVQISSDSYLPHKNTFYLTCILRCSVFSALVVSSYWPWPASPQQLLAQPAPPIAGHANAILPCELIAQSCLILQAWLTTGLPDIWPIASCWANNSQVGPWHHHNTAVVLKGTRAHYLVCSEQVWT